MKRFASPRILEGEVGFQPLTELTTPGDIRYLLRRDVLPKPQRNLCRQISGRILILFRRQRRDISRLGAVGKLHHGRGQVVSHRLAVFADDRICVQDFAEHVAGKGQQVADAFVAQGGGGAHTYQLTRWQVQPALEAADQAREIRTLSAVEGMQLVHHQIAQCIGLLLRPQRCICGADQQEIQHFVVGQQDIRGILAQRVAVGDDREAAVLQLSHPVGLHRRLIAHIEAGADAGQRGGFDDFFRNAPGLIAG